MERNSLLPDVRDTDTSAPDRYKTEPPAHDSPGKPVLRHMSVGEKTAEANDGGGSQPKAAPARGSARFERLLSGLGAGTLVDVEPDKVKDEIRRWAKKVAALVRQLSFGAWPEKGDGSSEQQGASDDTSAG
ncbi:hypothetical protein GQ55_5G188500 [Panicum hallii var. hallii]|uniref:Uncharacterized protein n=1 Tax=Panicum hallii var. hallii TaxID=1504633 RepID=A0A2T7DHU0_9POAL|nr:hypothetical protein GQ55_5G188500 [Panicum hallii var. hallii]